MPEPLLVPGAMAGVRGNGAGFGGATAGRRGPTSGALYINVYIYKCLYIRLVYFIFNKCSVIFDYALFLYYDFIFYVLSC